MDEKTLRFQCLQTANSLLGMNFPGALITHTPDDALALAAKLYSWVTTGA